jgi:histidinol dehydrogenase
MLKVLRDRKEIADFIKVISGRGGGNNSEVEKTVLEIMKDVKENGDSAVKKYTAKFDCENPQYYRVPEEALRSAYENADRELLCALERCKKNIEVFHEKQKRAGYTIEQDNGVILKQRINAVGRVGLYVPGGTAPLISSVLMCAVPAKIAGVGEIIIATPPRKDGTPNPDILAAARLCGVNQVFLCGGAQAVAAMAYGTEEIPKADKIVGPGNAYVTTAKKLLFGVIDIDMIAGPSEILIIADEEANPHYIAADLLSQAEHDTLASAVLITTSEKVAEETIAELEKQLVELPRKEMCEKSLKDYGAVIIVQDMEEAVEISNKIAPEHLEILTANPFEFEEKIINVGSLFLGAYSPEPLGDYFAGPNHVLPTNGTARFFSPLSVDDFTKKSSSIFYPKEALLEAAKDIILVAEREELTAHANSIKIRCGYEK